MGPNGNFEKLMKNYKKSKRGVQDLIKIKNHFMSNLATNGHPLVSTKQYAPISI